MGESLEMHYFLFQAWNNAKLSEGQENNLKIMRRSNE